MIHLYSVSKMIPCLSTKLHVCFTSISLVSLAINLALEIKVRGLIIPKSWIQRCSFCNIITKVLCFKMWSQGLGQAATTQRYFVSLLRSLSGEYSNPLLKQGFWVKNYSGWLILLRASQRTSSLWLQQWPPGVQLMQICRRWRSLCLFECKTQLGRTSNTTLQI